jgi:hypothetical protein
MTSVVTAGLAQITRYSVSFSASAANISFYSNNLITHFSVFLNRTTHILYFGFRVRSLDQYQGQ